MEQPRVALDSAKGASHHTLQIAEPFRRQMRQISCLHGRPDELDGREFGGIRGGAFDPKPVSVRSDVLRNLFRSVRGEAVPDEQQLLAVKFNLEVMEQLKKIVLVHAPRLKPEKYPRSFAVRREHEHSCHGEALP